MCRQRPGPEDLREAQADEVAQQHGVKIKYSETTGLRSKNTRTPNTQSETNNPTRNVSL